MHKVSGSVHSSSSKKSNHKDKTFKATARLSTMGHRIDSIHVFYGRSKGSGKAYTMNVEGTKFYPRNCLSVTLGSCCQSENTIRSKMYQ